jgi:hypothetical protein
MNHEVMAVQQEWVEVNIVPSSREAPERLLLDVVDPLVHDRLEGRVETWFYFWEPELRLRIRWQQPKRAAEGRDELIAFLDAAERGGMLASWYEGSHGKKGGTYLGEAALYGEEVWELTSKDWMGGSELALALVKLDSENRLTRPRSFHWERRVHLFSNQLLLDEVPLCLRQARGYLSMRDTGDPRVRELMGAIERYLAPRA